MWRSDICSNEIDDSQKVAQDLLLLPFNGDVVTAHTLGPNNEGQWVWIG